MIECFTRATEIFSSNIFEFGKACQLYKSMLDKNFGERFCLGGHCITVYMVEIELADGTWGAGPKIFYSEKEAQQEIERLKSIYPFIPNFRVIERKENKSEA